MKVLLVTDVDKLGWFGDVVEVADGFARNYLLPEKLAVVPTEAKLRSLQQETAKRAEQRVQDVERLKQVAEAVEGAEAVIAAKANEQGHLFGSVAAHEIAANLREQGFSVADEVVPWVARNHRSNTFSGHCIIGEEISAGCRATGWCPGSAGRGPGS